MADCFGRRIVTGNIIASSHRKRTIADSRQSCTTIVRLNDKVTKRDDNTNCHPVTLTYVNHVIALAYTNNTTAVLRINRFACLQDCLLTHLDIGY